MEEEKKTTEEALVEEKDTSTKPAPATSTTTPASTTTATAPTGKRKGSKKKHVSRGKIFIQASYNNTIVSFTDMSGNVLTQSSAGRCGFKGPKKSTPYAAGVIVRDAAERIRDVGLKDVEVYVNGIGSGREGAVRALNAQGFNMVLIRDMTPIPHNGCRPKKPRRV